MRARSLFSLGVAFAFLAAAAVAQAGVKGDYLEMRTCSIYTGPCFANGEVGVTGHEAFMAWQIESGDHQGVNLAGLKVVLAVKAADTLAMGGGMVVNPFPARSVILVDEKANSAQRAALVEFVKQQAGPLAANVVRVDAMPIDMKLDHTEMAASLKAGNEVSMQTRKLQSGDCVCSNEEIYYPPLTKVQNYAPAFTLDAKFVGKGLGTQWSAPGTRSAFLATFGE